MRPEAQRFLQELDEEIGRHPNKKDIMAEYELHVYELLNDEAVGDEDVYTILVKRLGSPIEIAQLWEQEKAITPKKTQWLFVLINIFLFIAGIVLTISYNIFRWEWIEILWEGLTEATSIIIVVYILFWGLLGYEIGKEFGDGGRKLLKKTFLLSIIPNLLLMYLTIFKLIPYEWFQPILSVRFIIICIICTGILYPVSWLGFKWGRKASV
ncbi:hypothetical protein CIL05_18120 [Virgibacillus profundi]|uniref:DUF1700 domain-containing protein n=1 Tax=Virgibacillus profundi TaxID=2024555 RepID=A0A2A2IAH2_9BACI|nr:hypothetical protein [Virgibacillus profundi]PAV28284.1 hypothetical protein CIL05_18120 [Virgibacillus profundi]PXY52588.1 hypothetical protein CIT14_17560 [Virgibacillus profundi]